MVVFDKLEITPDGKYLDVHAHINKASYFNKNYIKGIFITTEKDFVYRDLSDKKLVYSKTFKK